MRSRPVGRQITWLLWPELAKRALSSRLPPKYVFANLELARRRWGPAAMPEERGGKRANEE